LFIWDGIIKQEMPVDNGYQCRCPPKAVYVVTFVGYRAMPQENQMRRQRNLRLQPLE
jgi:hypothetical protein